MHGGCSLTCATCGRAWRTACPASWPAAVKFPFFLDEAPSADRLTEIAAALVDGLIHIDPRCRPEKDVFIWFSKFRTEIATWQGGRFHVIDTTPKNPFGGANA
jgi:hypothetical protein